MTRQLMCGRFSTCRRQRQLSLDEIRTGLDRFRAYRWLRWALHGLLEGNDGEQMNEQEITPVRTVLWQRLSEPSLESFALYQHQAGFEFRGTVVLELEGQPSCVSYRILTTVDWLTRQVTVELRRGAEEKSLELRVDDEQRWWQGERELTPLRGFYDVDLSVTPATNTLPLRRLELGVGRDHEVTAAWLKFPELDLEPLPQRYTRVGERDYRYESGTALADFSADLRIDDVGLVTNYLSGDRGWKRVRTTT